MVGASPLCPMRLPSRPNGSSEGRQRADRRRTAPRGGEIS